ncbi:hypothetical protein [Clostridium cellulovorans]|uniref:Uncharacterized protein n=1 Tax=Clostridium cellulovorans (strain ATCC 35296 / DSM 3052 / OCM 3 / 743B) TaxID=573061 RepID=D9SKF4_CLOC7|nr:hypothetical protein [Clostridium cellulovorans]ADL51450.1 hypothetical protein Clocel_1706 [Clostridium cellulovorans 743B]
MEYILNKIDENVRRKVNEINRPNKIHSAKNYKLETKKRESNKKIELKQGEVYLVDAEDVFTVEAVEVVEDKKIGRFIDRKE